MKDASDRQRGLLLRKRIWMWPRRIWERGIRVRAANLALLLLAGLLAVDTLEGLRRVPPLLTEAGVEGDALDQFLSLGRHQQTFILLLLLTVLIIVLAAAYLVLRPLKESAERMNAGEKLPLRGSREVQDLARAYNAIYAETMRQNDRLLYRAEHDALTRLYNRGAFEKLRASHQDENVGLMIMDVDHFKDVNDNFGHDTGDRVLQKVARLLEGNFRSTDYPCRIGGDEFAVIITELSSHIPNVRSVIQRKIDAISTGLQNTEDGLPPVTLSIGVAFGNQCTPGCDIFKLADEALYQVKEGGRNGYAFYDRKQ